MPSMFQAEVFALITAERTYQDRKWGTISDHPHSVGEWLLVIQGKLEEAVAAWQKSKGDVPALSKLVMVAATAVACLEQHGEQVFASAIRDMEFTKTNCGYMSPNERSKAWWPTLEMIVSNREASAVCKALRESLDKGRIPDASTPETR